MLIIYYLLNISLNTESLHAACSHFLGFCCEACSPAITFMASWSTCLKRLQLAQYYYLGIAFEDWAFSVTLRCCQLLFGNTHFNYAIFIVSGYPYSYYLYIVLIFIGANDLKKIIAYFIHHSYVFIFIRVIY